MRIQTVNLTFEVAPLHPGESQSPMEIRWLGRTFEWRPGTGLGTSHLDSEDAAFLLALPSILLVCCAEYVANEAAARKKLTSEKKKPSRRRRAR